MREREELTLREAWNRDYSGRRESWERLVCDFLNEYGDARIIPPVCPDCKGSGLRDEDLVDGVDYTCPTCHGVQPVSIVMPETREALRLVVGRALMATTEAHCDSSEFMQDVDARTDEILTALLGGGVERVREVWTKDGSGTWWNADHSGSRVIEGVCGNRIAFLYGEIPDV